MPASSSQALGSQGPPARTTFVAGVEQATDQPDQFLVALVAFRGRRPVVFGGREGVVT